MFRGSAYSIQTERDLSLSNLAEENIKIALVGVADVGKSSIVNCIDKQKFNEDIEPTNGFQLSFKKIKISHRLLVNLTIWDASGLRMQQYIQDNKLKHFDGILYVYDLSNPYSIIQLQPIYESINKNAANEYIQVLVGNKADLVVVKDSKTQLYNIPPNSQAFSLGEKFSQKHKVLHQNVSAKYNTHITDCFVLIITEILNKKRHLRISRFSEEESVEIEEEEEKKTCNWKCQWQNCSVM